MNNPQPDPTAHIEVLARLLCAADVHVHDGDHPTWQELRVAEHGRGQDDYRKAARWLAARLTVTPPSSAGLVVVPPTTALRDRIAAAIWERQNPGRSYADCDYRWKADAEADADAVLGVLPAGSKDTTTLTDAERTMLTYALDQAQERIWSEGGFTDEDQAAVTSLRRLAAETQPEKRTPCDQPNACDGDELCDTHEREQAHAEGEHAFCGIECETVLPSEQMRNAILYNALPGSKNMLAELERRAAAHQPAAVQTDEDA